MPDSNFFQSQADNIRQLIRQKNVTKARQILERLLNEYPHNPIILSLSAEFFLATKQYSQALSFLQQSLQLNPHDMNCQIMRIHCLLHNDEIKNAKTHLTSLITQKHDNPILLNELASLSAKLGLIEKSITLYKQAIAIKPNFYGFYFNLASSYRMAGKIEEAIKTLDIALTLNPNDFEAIQLRSTIKRQTPRKNHICKLKERLTTTKLPLVGKMHLHFSLAKEYEDLENYSESFKHIEKGNCIKRGMFQYNITEDIDKLKGIELHYNNSRLAANKSNPNLGQEAIFILGLPRTGSTLVERILGNHSMVNSAGELHVLPSLLSPPQDKLEFDKIGQTYLKKAKQWVASSPYFIDKWPMNSLHIGAIHLALPKAKVIHVQRNPLDTCYAIYKNLFANAYPFSYVLKEIAQYYIAHHQLMNHWYHALEGKIYAIKYENLIKDPNTEIANLLSHCQLKWQTSCVEFVSNSEYSSTASATQIREPIYKSSVNKWKHYQSELSTLKQTLEGAGIQCE